MFFCLGELYRRRDPYDHGQEAQHPQHVRHRSRRSRKVDPDRFPRSQSRYHRRIQGRRNENHRHQEGRAGEMHHHQIDVSFKLSFDLDCSLIKIINDEIYFA